MDEQALASIGFDRLLILRSAEKPLAAKRRNILEGLAHWMLSIFKFMVPTQEQPVRPTKIAEMVDALLMSAPAGITIVSPQEMWELSQCASENMLASVKARFDKHSQIS
jgi:hypothetical protein